VSIQENRYELKKKTFNGRIFSKTFNDDRLFEQRNSQAVQQGTAYVPK